MDSEVNIKMGFEDNASAPLDRSTRDINRRWREMRDQQRAVGRQFELNHRVFSQTVRTLSQLGNIAQRGIGIFQAYTLAQMRVADAQRNLRDIRKDLQEAIAEGDMEKVTQLTEEEKRAIEDLNRAQQDNIFNYITSGIVIAGMASSITTKAIPALARLRGHLGATDTKLKGFQSTMDKFTGSTGGKESPKASTGGKGGGGKGMGTSTKVGIGGASIMLAPIIEDILTSEDPLGRLQKWIGGGDLGNFKLGPINFKSDNNQNSGIPIEIQVKMGNQTVTKKIGAGTGQTYTVE